MPCRPMLTLLLAIAATSMAADGGCLACHADQRTGFNASHAFAADDCTACHAGDPTSDIEEDAHAGLIPFPGDLATAERACGGCHAGRVAGVTDNLMHTGRGMVEVTRRAVNGSGESASAANLQSLHHGPADSMLRKQCASCHLGQPKTAHALDVTLDRGGGCAACHINDYPETGHPALTTTVEDGRCFGCHSRSGRISLSFAGLAESDPVPGSATAPLRLADGRYVARMPADVHYLAGMSCIDCHTSVGLMGAAGDARHQREAVDIACADCHGMGDSMIGLQDWPPGLRSMQRQLPFAADDATQFAATANHGTPLWNIELVDGGAWLHTKNTGRKLWIPQADPNRPGHDSQHAQVTCAACHSQWAPQCFGCHMEYDPAGEQWDHVDRQVTPGRWSDRRWHVDNTLPALGVNSDGNIEAFVPGMIMTVSHPSFDEDLFVRQFAPLSPHTNGAARSCASCHRSSQALGLGEGEVEITDEGLEFVPRYEALRDGLPADAWTSPDNSLGGQSPFPGQRPFSYLEMLTILEAWIDADPAATD